jgi:hypothetical protein
VRLLQRFGHKADVLEPRVVPLEARIVLGPKRFEDSQVLVSNLPAFGKRWRTDGLEPSSIQPTPQPTVTRPCDSTSMVASALAVNMGLRWGTTMIDVNKRIFVVAAARYDINTSCSRQSPSAAPTILRAVLYG